MSYPRRDRKRKRLSLGAASVSVADTRTEGKTPRLSAWLEPTVTMGLYTMMERLSESGRSHRRNRHVTNSYLCYRCYWLSDTNLPPPLPLIARSTRRFLSLFIASLALLQISVPDDILYRIMGYVRRINYRRYSRRSARLLAHIYIYIFVHGDECSIKEEDSLEFAFVRNYASRATIRSIRLARNRFADEIIFPNR